MHDKGDVFKANASRLVDLLRLEAERIGCWRDGQRRWWRLRDLLERVGYAAEDDPACVGAAERRTFVFWEGKHRHEACYLSDYGAVLLIGYAPHDVAIPLQRRLAEAKVTVAREAASGRSPVRVLDPVDFHGQPLTVVDREGEPYVAMRPVVEGMGLAWSPQFVKLTEDSARWGTVTMSVTVAADAKVREMICLPLRKLVGWLMTLQLNRLAPEVAQRVLLYQNECDEVLWRYWSQGYAVNPRVQIPEDPTLLGLPDFNDPIAAAEGWLVEAKGRREAEAAARAAQERAAILAAKIEEDAPRVDFAERLEAAPTTHLIGAVAKMVQQGTGLAMGQNRLFEWLRENGYLHRVGARRNQPTQRSLDAGWFTMQVRTVDAGGEDRVKYTTRVTGKGLMHLYNQFYLLAAQQGLKPRLKPIMVTSAEVLQQLPLWAHEGDDEPDARLLAEAHQRLERN